MTEPTTDPNPLDDDAELTAYREAQQREYGTYEASARIYAGSALAYDIGHPVPVSNVVKHGYWFNGQVRLQDGADHAPEVAAMLDVADPVTDEGDAGTPDEKNGDE